MSRMVSIQPRDFDILGGIVLPAIETPGDLLQRRASQSRVLSGLGVAVYDGGLFQADRAPELQFRLSSLDEDAAMRRLATNHSEVVVGLWYGCFLATIQSYSLNGTTVTLQLLFKERLDES